MTTPNPTRKTDLIYQLNDRPPLPQTLFAALQHLLAMFVAVITPSLIICQALGVSAEQTNTIISMSLFASGISSFIQIRTFGPIGSGLLSVQGTSFNFLGPIIGAGLALKAGGASVESMMASIVIAMLVGYVMAYFMGMLDTRQASSSSALVALPIPMQFGLSFDWSLFIPLVLIFLITALEAIGDITATSEVSGEPVKGPVYMKRIKGGVLADGLNSAIAAVFNSFPNSTFSQNNGVILLTGVASRYVGYFIAGMLVLLGLFPGVASFVQLIPEPVLGGATIVMFGTIAAAGVRIISRVDLDRRAILIMALSFSMGLGIAQKPEILQFMPEFIKSIFSSGVAAGGITAIVLNLLLPEKLQDEEEEKAHEPAMAKR
ncbi:uracil-xanthine permease family protein [Vibrio vulnificus]|nr:uracil-xanthine permease family protein [Vibrio vulnificus]